MRLKSQPQIDLKQWLITYCKCQRKTEMSECPTLSLLLLIMKKKIWILIIKACPYHLSAAGPTKKRMLSLISWAKITFWIQNNFWTICRQLGCLILRRKKNQTYVAGREASPWLLKEWMVGWRRKEKIIRNLNLDQTLIIFKLLEMWGHHKQDLASMKQRTRNQKLINQRVQEMSTDLQPSNTTRKPSIS